MDDRMVKNINSTKAVVGGVQSTKGRAMKLRITLCLHTLTDYCVLLLLSLARNRLLLDPRETDPRTTIPKRR